MSAVGVRQHHPDCYNPLAAYTPFAMYVPGVTYACSSAMTGMEKYYGTAFTRVHSLLHTPGPRYEFGAHRPDCSGSCSYPAALTLPLLYLETPQLAGAHGLHAFARFSVDAAAEPAVAPATL